MNWDDLRFFLSVSRHGLVARAAAELGSDPTTVSRRVQRLERDVGQTLVERGRAGPRLTAAGRRLAEQAAAMETASAQVAALGAGALLRVSATEGFGTAFIAAHLAGFARAHPQVAIELVASTGLLSPSRRETDVAVMLTKPRRGPLVIRRLADYALQLYRRRSAVPVPASVADLAGLPLVGYIPDLIYAPELDYLDEIGAGLTATVRSSSIVGQHRLIAGGAGVGVLPCFIGDADASLQKLLPDVRIARTFWLAIHQDVRGRPEIRAFVDWLISITREHGALLAGGTDVPATCSAIDPGSST